MALDYRKCAQEIVDHIGGRENVAQAAHCATRLRLVIKDNSKVDKAYLDNVDGVKGMFESNGQLQLIIGTGTVNKVYDEFLDITGMTAATKDDVKAAAAAQQPLWKQLLKPIGDVFVPILPAIVASGLMMGLVEALGKVSPGFAQTDWYAFLDMVANTAFAYLPVIVAISAARVFGGNIFLGAVIGLLMIHSTLTNGWNAADGYGVWYLFGHIKIGNYTLGQINQLGYQGHVIPVMIAVLFMSKLEKWLHEHVPEMIDLFVTPLTTVFCTALVTFVVIGPIFSALENMVLAGAQILVSNPIGSMVMGAIYPATVVMGLHHMYNVIEAGMLSGAAGLNTWMPIASAANFAQFGACLAVGLKCRNQKTKAVAVPSSLSAALGITEPAIFGVNMRFFKPFAAGMIGGAVGSLVGGAYRHRRFCLRRYGYPGLPDHQQPAHVYDHPRHLRRHRLRGHQLHLEGRGEAGCGAGAACSGAGSCRLRQRRRGSGEGHHVHRRGRDPGSGRGQDHPASRSRTRPSPPAFSETASPSSRLPKMSTPPSTARSPRSLSRSTRSASPARATWSC